MDKPSVTVRFEEYLSESDLRDASIDMKRRALKYWLLLHGDCAMEDVTPSMAMAYRTDLHKGRQESSVNGYLNNFKGFFSWAWKSGRIASNPFVAVRPYKIDQMPRETFTADELTRLLAVATGAWRIRLCLHLMGGRKGEVLNLTRDECHLDSPQPHVLIAKKSKTAQTWPWKVKSHGLRWIAVPPVLRFSGGQEVNFLEEFKEHLANLPRDQVYVCLWPKYIDKMLQWQKQNTLTWGRRKDPTGNYSRMMKALQVRAGITRPRPPKEFRAAFGTVMIAKVGLQKAAEAMGHASTQTTLIYNRRSVESLLAEVTHNVADAYRAYET